MYKLYWFLRVSGFLPFNIISGVIIKDTFYGNVFLILYLMMWTICYHIFVMQSKDDRPDVVVTVSNMYYNFGTINILIIVLACTFQRNTVYEMWMIGSYFTNIKNIFCSFPVLNCKILIVTIMLFIIRFCGIVKTFYQKALMGYVARAISGLLLHEVTNIYVTAFKLNYIITTYTFAFTADEITNLLKKSNKNYMLVNKLSFLHETLYEMCYIFNYSVSLPLLTMFADCFLVITEQTYISMSKLYFSKNIYGRQIFWEYVICMILDKVTTVAIFLIASRNAIKSVSTNMKNIYV